MIIIGIDPSLNSTAITIYKKNNFVFYNYTNSKSGYKWIKDTKDIINYQFHQYINNDDFTESEIDKITIYDEITDKIINDVFNCIGDEQTSIYIEGYSYSAQAGKLIDLVTFSTILRYKLLKKKNISLFFIPPSSFKKNVASLIYKPDKKGVYRNENGKAGGSFDKKDMLNSLYHFKLKNIYFNYLIEKKDEILKMKNIPKPFDDINDSLLLVLCQLNS